MSKISKLFRAITLIAQRPALLNKVLDDSDVNKEAVAREYSLPEGLPVVNMADLVGTGVITVEPYCAMEGGSTPIDLALLKGLAAKKNDCDYFEIGTWRGESAANVASVARSCSTLNLSDEELLARGLDERYVKLHRFFSKKVPNITHVFGNSMTFDFSSHEKRYDLVFIDGDHHFESVKKDTETAFRLLRDEHSIIVWHDYGHDPASIRWDVLRGILAGTPAGRRKNLYRVSNTLCAVYTTQPLKSAPHKAFEDPDKHFRLDISIVK
jgi:predicted O-methyltransferase YrrM